MPDLKRLCCLFSTFLLLPSPREVSEIKSLESLLAMAGKVGAFHRVPLASLSGSEERRLLASSPELPLGEVHSIPGKVSGMGN